MQNIDKVLTIYLNETAELFECFLKKKNIPEKHIIPQKMYDPIFVK